MKFAELFGKATSRWIKYSEYDAVRAQNGDWYIMPVKDALPSVYDPIEKAEEMVVEALNIGLKLMGSARDFYTDERMIAEICVFAEKYGLLGFMTGLPTTPEFMEYESVYLPKNRHIRKESMPSKEYAKLFFPFDDKLNENPNLNIRYTKEGGGIMVSLAARIKPKAVEMAYQQTYAESADWLMTQFKDWAIIFVGSFLHYELVDTKEAEDAELYRQAIAAFDGNVPSFHIELFDKPVMVWDFNSLMAVIHLVLGLMITDDNQPLRSCKYCNRAFVAKHPKAEYCKPACKNKHNVYKSRGKE
ncbi:MAG: hypothetical protein LBI03_05155 [Clostridiales bacterium]|jgi:hypothetical protein|nr:hypothetical protein [Clostridiales bacterium]